jgi:NAD-dependent SIR2 family protein deacetylase
MTSSNPMPLNPAISSIPNHGPSNNVASFKNILSSSTRVLALCGAGLGASSGLDTFRGKGGMWRNYRSESLATPEAFERDPGLVWLFYSYRRHKALGAEPNKGHFALAELAKRMRKREDEGFVCLTQNVDGESVARWVLYFVFCC